MIWVYSQTLLGVWSLKSSVDSFRSWATFLCAISHAWLAHIYANVRSDLRKAHTTRDRNACFPHGSQMKASPVHATWRCQQKTLVRLGVWPTLISAEGWLGSSVSPSISRERCVESAGTCCESSPSLEGSLVDEATPMSRKMLAGFAMHVHAGTLLLAPSIQPLSINSTASPDAISEARSLASMSVTLSIDCRVLVEPRVSLDRLNEVSVLVCRLLLSSTGVTSAPINPSDCLGGTSDTGVDARADARVEYCISSWDSLSSGVISSEPEF